MEKFIISFTHMLMLMLSNATFALLESRLYVLSVFLFSVARDSNANIETRIAEISLIFLGLTDSSAHQQNCIPKFTAVQKEINIPK